MPESDQATQAEGGGAARQVARNTVVLALSRIGDRVSGFVLALLIAPRLGASGLGTFTAATAIYAVMAIAGEAGTTNYLVREITRDKTQTSNYLVHLSIVAIGVCLVLIAGLEVLVPHLGYTSDLRASVSVIALAILPTVLNSIQEAAFIAYGRVEFETYCTFVQTVIYIGIGATLLANGHGVPALMRTFVATEYAVTLVYFVLISRYIARLHLKFRRAEAKRLAIEMKAFTATSLLAAFFARPEVVILSLMSSAKEVGYYGAAIRVAELPSFIPQVFSTNVFTLLSRAFGQSEDRFREIQAKAIRYMMAFALPLTALILGAAPGIVRLLFGSHFGPAVVLLRILALNVLFVALMAVFWRSLAARGRQAAVLQVQVAVIGLRLGSGAALIAPFAALGAAIATSASSALQFVLLVIATARSGAPTPIFRPAWRFAMAAVPTTAVTWVLADHVSIWVTLPAGAVVYLLGAIAFRAVSADDRALMARLLPRALARGQ